MIEDPAPGWRNMAVDSALLDLAQAGAGFLRLYRWEPHCLSFGRHEPAARRYDRERVEGASLDCVRRPTGGRAVWHARELTYAVAAPLAWFGGLRAAYYRIHAMLAAALRSLGADPELAEGAPASAPGLGPGPCFASKAGGEVVVNGAKVIGSAQLRQGDAFLQHGSLLLEDDQALVDDLSLHTSSALPSGRTAALPLSHLLGRRVSFEEAASAVARSAESLRGGGVERGELPTEAATRAEHHAMRFRSPAWTWER